MTEMLVVEFLEDSEVELTDVPSDGVAFEVAVTADTTVVEVEHGVEIVVHGPPMVVGGTYVHTQSTPAATWIINHNLGKMIEPVVLLDSNPTVQVYPDVAHGSINQTTLTFPTPVTGKAYF